MASKFWDNCSTWDGAVEWATELINDENLNAAFRGHAWDSFWSIRGTKLLALIGMVGYKDGLDLKYGLPLLEIVNTDVHASPLLLRARELVKEGAFGGAVELALNEIESEAIANYRIYFTVLSTVKRALIHHYRR